MTTLYNLYYYIPGSDSDPEFADMIDFDTSQEIGLYSSRENAEAVIERLKNNPAFREYPEGFRILTQELDVDGYEGGFSTWQEALDALPD